MWIKGGDDRSNVKNVSREREVKKREKKRKEKKRKEKKSGGEKMRT